MTRSRAQDNYLPSRWLAPLRVIWAGCAITLFAFYFNGLGPRYAELAQLCQTQECVVLALTPGEFQIVERLGISLRAYALYQLILEGCLVVLFSALAGLIFWRRSDTWVGYVISLALLFLGLVFLAEETRVVERQIPDLRLVVDLLTSLSVGLLIMLLYLFPDGRFVPRWLGWIAAGLLGVVLVDPVLNQDGARASSSTQLVIAVFMIAAPLGLLSQIHRFRKVSSTAQRQQTKWVLLGFLSMFAGMLPWAMFVEIAPLPHGAPRLIFYLSMVPQYLLVGLFPIAVVISILRYRLWDIDVLIRRTLIYSLLTGLLALTYFGLVIVLQSAVASLGGARAEWVTVASTLAVAALVAPLRGRIQRFIDRRFYRTKYDAAQTLAEFAAAARDETDLSALVGRLAEAVRETMKPQHVSVWLRRPDTDGAPAVDHGRIQEETAG